MADLPAVPTRAVGEPSGTQPAVTAATNGSGAPSAFRGTLLWLALGSLPLVALTIVQVIPKPPIYEPGWRADATLVVNHQVRRDDLRPPPSLLGRLMAPPASRVVGGYLRTLVPAGSPVRPQDVLEVPRLPDRSAWILATLTARERPLAELLAERDSLAVCDTMRATQSCVIGLVLALHTPRTAEDSAWVLLGDPGGNWPRLTVLLASDHRSLAHVVGASFPPTGARRAR